MKSNLIVLTFALIILLNFTSAFLISDQGTNVREIATGNLTVLANLTIDIYDNSTAGNLIFEQNFSDAIFNGSWNVMIDPNLEYGKSYYKDYKINNEDLDFDGNERLEFQSSIGKVNNISFINFSLINSCSAGSSIRMIYENGSVVCETDDDSGISDLTNYALKNQSEIFTGNITTSQTGFFGWLGSLSSRINKLFIQNIDFNGTINGSGSINITGNISANYFVGDGSLLTNFPSGNGDNVSWNQSFANSLYATITWNYNQTAPFDKWAYNQTSSSGDGSYNATYNLWAYNQTSPFDKWAYNQTYSGSTYNATYASSTGNVSWNQSFANSLYATITWNYNQTSPFDKWSYNQTYSGSTYNATYNLWAYNQSSWLETIYGDNWYNHTSAIFSLIDEDQIYNHTLSVEGLYGKWFYNQTYSGSTFNVTYNKWSYNQTSPFDKWAYNQTTPSDSYTDTQIEAVNTTANIDSLGYLNKSGTNANQNVNISPYNLQVGNLTLTQKITFSLGEIIDNTVDGWIRITGNLDVVGDLNVTGSLNVTGNITTTDTFCFTADCSARMYHNGSGIIIIS